MVQEQTFKTNTDNSTVRAYIENGLVTLCQVRRQPSNDSIQADIVVVPLEELDHLVRNYYDSRQTPSSQDS